MPGIGTGVTGAIVPPAQPGGGKGAGRPGWMNPVKDPVSSFAEQILGNLKTELGPNGGPFTPQVLDSMKQSALETRSAADKQSRDQIMRDAVASGLGRSSGTISSLASAQNANSAAFSQQNRDAEKQATLGNYQARMQSIDQSMKYIDQARNWVLASDKSNMEKQQLLAKLQMAGASAAMAQQEMQMRIVGMMMNETQMQSPY